ncbi:MAG: RNHCP domain-containing protein [Bacillota bacterium]
MLQQRAYIGSGNDAFACAHCGAQVPPISGGGYRNHCPFCLHSLHVDEAPGDRASDCRGIMEPVGLHHHPRKGYQLVHRCTACGAVRRNRIAETGEAPDDPEQLRRVAMTAMRS